MTWFILKTVIFSFFKNKTVVEQYLPEKQTNCGTRKLKKHLTSLIELKPGYN